MTDAEARRHQQATSLEAVFEIYFRVLKHATASGLFAETEGKPLSADRFAKRFPLLFPVLEQLARHAHLIGCAALSFGLVGSRGFMDEML